MLLSLNIISEIVDINGLSPEEIAYRLTMSTAEIDDIKCINQHLNTVITARIENVIQHPNADKLTLVDLDTGKDKLRVVCGAPNHKKGDIVALATVGTKFSEEFIIKETKIRGEKSIGMLCSEKELGLSDDHSGILILPPGTPLGIKLSELYKGRTDIQLDIDNKSITHRPDLWGHVGFAREISAIFGCRFKFNINYDIQKTFKHIDNFKISIKDNSACARYCGLAVKNIKIEESPEWFKTKLISIGMRPISNIVDVTNYIMAELGEPMHAFDRKKLRGGEINVRLAKQEETLTTLDGEPRVLREDDIVIADGKGPIALAGVMGGGNSEIDDSTTEIILEAANFNSVKIRKTAQRLNMRTDAAVRFEKSLDPELCPAAIIRSYELIKQLIPEAEAVTDIIDAYPLKSNKIIVDTSFDFIRKKIGDDISDEEANNILNSLNFKTNINGNQLKVEVPSYRATGDISLPEDISEEVGRIYGYDHIKSKAPFVPCAPPAKNEKRLFERKIKDVFSRDHQMIEVSNYSFVGEDLLNKVGINEDKELRIQNPISREHDRLRRSLIPNIFMNIELNQRYNESFRIFEVGRVYRKNDRKSKDLAAETTYTAGAVYLKNPEIPLFYSARNAVKDLLNQLNIKNIKYIPAQKGLPSYAHPAKSLEIHIDNKFAGLIFEAHPGIMKNFGLKGKAALFDLNADIMFASAKIEKTFIELQKYPDVPFEISVLADKQKYAAEIHSIIEKSSKEFIKSIEIISVYESSPIPEGLKSVSFKIIFAAKDSTLSPEQIEKLQQKVIDDLKKNGLQLR